MEILSDVILIFSCPWCGTVVVKINKNVSPKKGLCYFLYIQCQKCCYLHELYTSARSEKGIDIDKRNVYNMNACGQGYAGS